ncbi:hypothetical protein [Kitasatospora sp. NPDC059599]|uniref:hypothetical protein n=1 Tax=Kitasatospora sp. NPDC059599 TaxID=3346880 RepID=UPI0036883345
MVPDHSPNPLGPFGIDLGNQREQAERLKKTIDESHGMWGAGDLKYAVHDALQLPAPKGDPGKLGEFAAAYNTANSQLDIIQMKVARVGAEHLPDAWTGQVGEKAAEVVKAAAVTVDRLGALPRALVFLGEVVRSGGTRHAAALPEPLPGPAAAVARGWLEAASMVAGDVTGDLLVARWLDAVAAVLALRVTHREASACRGAGS